MTKPISPKEVEQHALMRAPAYVFEAFNNMICKKYSQVIRDARVTQEEVIDEILRLAEQYDAKITRNDIFHNKWLDVEETYRAVGWGVRYDKPGLDENYKAFFVFSCKL